MDAGAAAYKRFLEGDESGFDELIGLYHDSLICFINRYVKNYAAAEDLAADSFVELLTHKGRYSFKSSFKTYLFSVGRHKAIDYVRHESRFGGVPLDTAWELSDTETVESSVLADEGKRRIAEIAATLPQDYAVYIHLCYFEGISQEEIGKIMKKTKKQMANLAHRAKKALQEAMRKEGITA